MQLRGVHRDKQAMAAGLQNMYRWLGTAVVRQENADVVMFDLYVSEDSRTDQYWDPWLRVQSIDDYFYSRFSEVRENVDYRKNQEVMIFLKAFVKENWWSIRNNTPFLG